MTFNYFKTAVAKKLKSRYLLFVILFLAFLLRIYKVSSFPPGLYSDEAAYGYNAFSLLTTGRDEYGISWPLTLKNFGDYKPPMTAWVTMPFIQLFGLNEFAVRLPSVIAGTITVAIIFLLAQEISPSRQGLKVKGQKWLPHLAAFLLAISPWHLHFSRSAMLVGLEAMFISLGVLLFLKALKKPTLFYFSALSFTASIYTYYGSRLSVPLLVLALSLIFARQLKKNPKHFLLSGLLSLILLSPLALSFLKSPTTLTGRARTISIFYDPGIRAKLWQAHTLNGPNFPRALGRFFHNKPYYYFQDILRRYLQHFSIDFLSLTGDQTPPFDIPNQGQLYWFEIIFILIALCSLFKQKINPYQKALLAYLFIAPITSALTFITPASNRSFNMVIPLTLITALGITQAYQKINKVPNLAKTIVIILLYLFSFKAYLIHYYTDIPTKIPHKYHYGRKQLVAKVKDLQNNYDQIVFSNREGPAYIWLLFYLGFPPQNYWASVEVDDTLNELGWLHINSFDKYKFPRYFDWQTVEKATKILYVGYEDQIPDSWEHQQYTLEVVDKIKYPTGETAFKLVHLNL